MKRSMFLKRVLSVLLICGIVLGLVPNVMLPVFAASNLAVGFEGQDADIFSALGFDTTIKPESYDAETTDNPYGRDKLTGNQVFELLTASSTGTKIYGKDNNSVSATSISGVPSGGGNIPLKMFAVASADFDGDGLNGEAVYVGYTDINYTSTAISNLYLCIYDGVDNVYSATKQVGAISPVNTVPAGHVSAGVQLELDVAWQNLLQVAAGDFDGDGVAEIAVYIGEKGKARVDIYKYQKTSQSGANDWFNLSNWSRVWSHALSADVVPNMVSLCAGDFNRDGVDDLAISGGSAVFYQQGGTTFHSPYLQKSKATVLWGGKSGMLQTGTALNLNESELGEQVRVSLISGDLNGDGYKELIATGQPQSDLAAFASGVGLIGLKHTGNTRRTISTYVYDAKRGLVKDTCGLHKPIDGEYITISTGENSTTTSWQSGIGR